MRASSLVVLVVAMVGCASVRPAHPPASTPAATSATSPSKADVARYAEQLLRENYTANGPGAAVIIARGDEVLFRGARGMSDVEHAKPLAPDDLFKIGSITKQFAAAGLLTLAEAGKVSLDDPLSKFVKDYPDGDHITVLELLNHTSGVKSYTDIRAPDDLVPRGTPTAVLIDSFRNAKPEFAPGTSWAYDNSGYVLVGAVIEAASGMTWHAYLRQTFFQPLGLTHTGYDEDPLIVAREVHGYVLADGKAVPAAGLAAVHADGALVSNVDDLLKWNRALHEGRVLKQESYRRMITPVGKAEAEQYGFGIWHTTLRDSEMLAHSGHISGFSAYLLYLPESRVSVAILQNMDRATGVLDPTATARELAAFTIGKPYETPKATVVDAATLLQAQGTYGTDPQGPQEFSRQGARILRTVNGKLTAAHTAAQRSELIPIGADTFQYQDGFDRLQLVRDNVGAVSAIRTFPWGERDGLLLTRMSGPPPAAQITLPPGALGRVAGSYSGDGMTLRIFVENGQLKGDIGQPPVINLLPESASRFFVAEVDSTLEFDSVAGSPGTATLRQGSETVVFKRKP
jgi:CubicO group peptidase (beta-lactamase class C family)